MLGLNSNLVSRRSPRNKLWCNCSIKIQIFQSGKYSWKRRVQIVIIFKNLPQCVKQYFTNLFFQHIWRNKDDCKHDDCYEGSEHPEYPCIYCEDMVKAETQVHDVTHEHDPQRHGGHLTMKTHKDDQSLVAETYLFPGTDIHRRGGYLDADDAI